MRLTTMTEDKIKQTTSDEKLLKIQTGYSVDFN